MKITPRVTAASGLGHVDAFKKKPDDLIFFVNFQENGMFKQLDESLIDCCSKRTIFPGRRRWYQSI